jgi:hypothetical protein
MPATASDTKRGSRIELLHIGAPDRVWLKAASAVLKAALGRIDPQRPKIPLLTIASLDQEFWVSDSETQPELG